MKSYRGPKWVPFPYVAEATDGRVIFGETGFGNVDPDSLCANIPALARYAVGLGGFEVVRLGGQLGDGDRVELKGASAHQDGTAISAQSVTIAAEKSTGSAQSDIGLNRGGMRNGTLELTWNTTPMLDRISFEESKDPRIAAKMIDRRVRLDMARPIWEHNVGNAVDLNEPGVLSQVMGILLATSSLTSLQELSTGHYFKLPVMAALGAGRLMLNSRFARSVGEEFLIDPLMPQAALSGPYRSMGIPNIRPTRAAIAAAGLATHRLVKAA